VQGTYDIQNILDVFVLCFREDNNIMKVDYHCAAVNILAQDLIHHPLEGFGGVGKSKGHDSKLEVPVPTGKCGLFLRIIR
jgi:hypothetical protein